MTVPMCFCPVTVQRWQVRQKSSCTRVLTWRYLKYIFRKVFLFIQLQVGDATHYKNINDSLTLIRKLPNDVTIICGDNEEIESNKYILALFSPIIRRHISSSSTFSFLTAPHSALNFFSTWSPVDLLSQKNYQMKL